MDFDRDGIVEIPALSKGAVYSEPRAMSNGDYNPFREEYIDPTAPDPNVDFTGFDVPYDDRGQTLSDTAGTGFAPRAGMGGGMSGRGASGGSLPGGLRSAGSGFTLPQTRRRGRTSPSLPRRPTGSRISFRGAVSRWSPAPVRDECPGVHPFRGYGRAAAAGGRGASGIYRSPAVGRRVPRRAAGREVRRGGRAACPRAHSL